MEWNLLEWNVVHWSRMKSVGMEWDDLKEKFRCYEVQIEESEKPAAARNRTQDTWRVQPVLCH